MHAGTHAPDNWLQTFANIDEIDPNDIVDSVLNDWDMQESKNRINSFFRANPSTRTDAALSTYTSTTVSNTGFPYASQQVFIRVSVELPYESEIFSLVQCGDIDGTRALLTSGKTTIDAVDPYGLGLLYVSSSKVAVLDNLTSNISMLPIIAGEATALLSPSTCVRP